jgi:Uma2 family endonuclease
MFTSERKPERMTVADYLRMEAESEERHVYLDGEVFAMAGESEFHADISANLVGLIHAQLKGRSCRVRTKDTKVRSGPVGPRPLRDTAGMYSYPDAVVVCGEPEYDDDHRTVIRNPAVIVEVLSPTTEAFDRGRKFDRYQMWNPTLTDYLLVSQDEPRIEHYTRQPDGSWRYTSTPGLDAAVTVSSIGVILRLADVFDRVTFPAPETDDHPPG